MSACSLSSAWSGVFRLIKRLAAKRKGGKKDPESIQISCADNSLSFGQLLVSCKPEPKGVDFVEKAFSIQHLACKMHCVWAQWLWVWEWVSNFILKLMWKEEGKRCSQRKSSEHKSKISKSVKSFEAQKDINKHICMRITWTELLLSK